MKRMLFNATNPEELRVAIVDGQKLVDIDIESSGRESRKSNIYKGLITRLEPSLDACFVNYGEERQGFLPLKEISKEFFKPGVESNGRNRIQDVIQEGQELVVQMDKEERSNKGAALTTFISLAGRYLVLMPNNPRGGGVSRRVEGEERQELREAMDRLIYPAGMSLIARTAGIGRKADELQWDLNYLLQLWQAIDSAAKSAPGAFLIYQESSLVIRAIRDYFVSDIGEILVDNPLIYEQARQFMGHVMPEMLDRVKIYQEDVPLFSRFQIEHQIETAYARTVTLPSGGSIVLDHTEALVAIDVNSARSTRGTDIEETALRTNLEAAEEVARQLRLRDLGGLIVIDFIDMDNPKNQREVETRLKDTLHHDRARVQLGKISRFGLMELTRQRLRPSLNEGSHIACPRCAGIGVIRDTESSALHVLREIHQEALKGQSAALVCHVSIDVATYLFNEKQYEIQNLKDQNKIGITIIPSRALETPHHKIERIRHDDERLNTYRPSYSYGQPEIGEETNAYLDRKLHPLPTRQTAVVKGITPPPPPANSPGIENQTFSVQPTAMEAANTRTTSPQNTESTLGIVGRVLGWLWNKAANEATTTQWPDAETNTPLHTQDTAKVPQTGLSDGTNQRAEPASGTSKLPERQPLAPLPRPRSTQRLQSQGALQNQEPSGYPKRTTPGRRAAIPAGLATEESKLISLEENTAPGQRGQAIQASSVDSPRNFPSEQDTAPQDMRTGRPAVKREPSNPPAPLGNRSRNAPGSKSRDATFSDTLQPNTSAKETRTSTGKGRPPATVSAEKFDEPQSFSESTHTSKGYAPEAQKSKEKVYSKPGQNNAELFPKQGLTSPSAPAQTTDSPNSPEESHRLPIHGAFNLPIFGVGPIPAPSKPELYQADSQFDEAKNDALQTGQRRRSNRYPRRRSGHGKTSDLQEAYVANWETHSNPEMQPPSIDITMTPDMPLVPSSLETFTHPEPKSFGMQPENLLVNTQHQEKMLVPSAKQPESLPLSQAQLSSRNLTGDIAPTHKETLDKETISTHNIQEEKQKPITSGVGKEALTPKKIPDPPLSVTELKQLISESGMQLVETNPVQIKAQTQATESKPKAIVPHRRIRKTRSTTANEFPLEQVETSQVPSLPPH